jgi:hypothetical protein
VDELADRLGFFPNANVALVNVRPETRALLSLDDVQLLERASERLDVLIYCSDELANVKRRVHVLSGFVRSGGRMWVGHPAPGSGLATDVGSGDVADIGRGRRPRGTGFDWSGRLETGGIREALTHELPVKTSSNSASVPALAHEGR